MRRVGQAPGDAHQHLCLAFGHAFAHHRVAVLDRLRLGGRPDEQPVAGDEVVDLAGHLHLTGRQHDQVVADAFELGHHVRREDDRQAVLGHRGHEGRHELVTGQRVEPRHRFVEHHQVGPFGERSDQRDLGVLAARQLADLAAEGNIELGHAPSRPDVVPASVEVAGETQRVVDREAGVERRVLRHEPDALQGGRRPGRQAVEHGDAARCGGDQADREVQQGRLAGAVRADQRDDVAGGHSQATVAQRPRAPVAFADACGDDRVHDTARRSSASRTSVSALENSATMSSSSRPAWRASTIQASTRRRNAANPSGGRLPSVPSMKVPSPGRPDARPRCSRLAIGLEHGVGVDGEARDHVFDARQLVTGFEVAQAQRLFDLLHELQVGRYARRGVQTELDR